MAQSTATFRSLNQGLQVGQNFGAIDNKFYQTEDRCLSDLRITDPRDDRKRILDTKGGLLQDSYGWILTNPDFLQWRENDQNHLLWIKGDPGKGKTMLLCGIVKELSPSTRLEDAEASTLLSYFFCQGTDSRINSATAVLRGLIYLLVKQQESLISHVRERYEDAGKALFEDANAWVALSSIFRNILQDQNLKSTVLMIDALDECETGLPELLDLVVEHSSSPRVKWIVSSRNWLSIEEQLETAELKVRLCLELNEQSISTAVDIYIKHKVNELARLKKYDKELRDAVQDYLSANANDTFLWVALVCQELAGPKVQKRHTRAKLASFPPKLDSVYMRMMEQLYGSPDEDLYKEILAVISVAYRPVTLVELKVLIESLEDSDDDNELREIITSCGSFLTCRDEIVYFVHQSAKDFLLNEKPSRILPSGTANQHRILFSRSLDALSVALRRDIYSLRQPGLSIDQVSPPEPDPLSPIRYCCTFWADHLSDSRSVQDLQDGGVVHSFFQKLYLNWLESLSLLGSMSVGVRAVQKLESLTRSIEAPQLVGLLRDARRFILLHWQLIEFAPLQVYSSALVFSPTHSKVRELFEGDDLEWITLKPNMETSWGACLQTVEGHLGWVHCIAFSPDGQQLASGSEDTTVKIWETTTYSCLKTLEGHESGANSIAFSTNGQQLASGSGHVGFPGTIKIWDIATGQCVQSIESHGWVNSVAFASDNQQLASGLDNSTLKIWETNTGVCLQNFEGHIGGVTSAAFSPNSQWLVSGSNDKTIKIWEVATGVCRHTLKGHGKGVKFITFSANGLLLASGSADTTIMLWEVATGVRMQTLEGHNDEVNSIAFSADCQQLASGSGDCTIKIWEASTGVCLQTLKGHSDEVESIAFSPRSQQLASGGDTIKIWETGNGVFVKTLEDHDFGVRSIITSPNYQRLASLADDNTIKIWEVATGVCEQTLRGNGDWVNCIAFSIDSRQLASGLSNSPSKIWEVATGMCMQSLEGSSGIYCIAFSANGQQLVSGSNQTPCKIQIWDTATGLCLQEIEDHFKLVKSVAISPDSQQVASGSFDGDIEIWDVVTGKCVQTSLRKIYPITALAFSADGRRLASGDSDAIDVWDADTGEHLLRFKIYFDEVRFIAFSDDGHSLSTQMGRLNIDLSPSTKNKPSETIFQHANYAGNLISTDGTWIMKDQQRVLWLPPEYRSSDLVVIESTIAIGCRSGRVLVMRF